MKYKIFAFVSLLFSCNSNNPNNDTGKVPVQNLEKIDTATNSVGNVIIISEIRERSLSYYISNNFQKIDSLLALNKQYKNEVDDPYLQKIVLKDKSMNYLIDYLDSINCISYPDSDSYIYTNYKIELYNKNADRKMCLYLLPKDIIHFFNGLKEHLNKSENKDEFKVINMLFDQFIKKAQKELR